MKRPGLRIRARRLAGKCADAYSADRYRNWSSVAFVLLQRGFGEREAEAIMRSKWVRWAADGWDNDQYGRIPAAAVTRWLETHAEFAVKELPALVAGTFEGGA